MSESETNRSLVRIAVAGLVRAPRRGKLALAFNIVLLLGVTAFVVMDIEEGESAALRLVALSMVAGGAILLSFASVLWGLSQQDANCSLFELKRRALSTRVRKLDEVLIAFPVFAFVAGCMIAVGLGMFLAVATRSSAVAMIAGMAGWFLFWTTSMISGTTRFLYTHAREQAAAAERARGEATESQLAALQAQVNPHFLFNTLNTVASLVRTDAAAAEATVENLAVVLRRTLDRSRRILSTVDDEIDHLAAYISVAKQRFENRLQVHWAVAAEARELLLPTMTMQPLVENALKHGIGARLEGGALHIGAHVESVSRGSAGPVEVSRGETAGASRLIVEVADDGPGFPRRHTEGTGLANLRARLETLYGDQADLRIDRSGPGSRVVVSLPAVRSVGEILGEATDTPATAVAIAVE